MRGKHALGGWLVQVRLGFIIRSWQTGWRTCKVGELELGELDGANLMGQTGIGEIALNNRSWYLIIRTSSGPLLLLTFNQTKPNSTFRALPCRAHHPSQSRAHVETNNMSPFNKFMRGDQTSRNKIGEILTV